MSFFRNIRTTITRGKSSSRDTTPVRTSSTSSRPGSIVNVGNATVGRRDSIESRTDSLFNRSETFILNSDQEDKDHSNTSTLEKKSKKSKVLSKFSTFTKRKKPASPTDNTAYEHHPSDSATNTYYKWKSEGASTLDYDAQSDPFNFLYEQHSSLKSLHNGSTSSAESTSGRGSTTGSLFDSSTYRKSKMPPSQLKEQLQQLKTHTHTNPNLHEAEEVESEADKYKTVTLNSFRKSFRDKFLQQPNVPHNPAWFVEVEVPAEKDTERTRRESKENRPDFLVFGNENYRPESRSPVRERNERASRPLKRSPVKRNETFRVERPSIETHHEHAARAGPQAHTAQLGTTQPSIRIEIKNSITPNLPGRMVPVGVAKPMPSQYTNHYYQQQQQQQQQQQRTPTEIPTITTTTRTTTRLNKDKSPLRGWSKSITVSPSRNHSRGRSGRYQTLVQIRNDVNQAKSNQGQPSTTTTLNSNNNTRGRLSTRIQLGGSPAMQKRLSTAGSRYSLATATPSHSSAGTSTTLSSYELFKKNSTAPNKLPPTTATTQPTTKHTYFGGSHMHPTIATSNNSSASRTLYGIGNNAAAFNDSYAPPASKHQTLAQPADSRIPSSTVGGTAAGGGGCYLSRRGDQCQQQHQHRVLVPVQRRSRSPIKMPWR